jgi:hypothetical protein
MSFTLLPLLLVSLLSAVQVRSNTFPATVEVDLVFPRNDTYAPARLIPIVWAFQNSQLAASLDPYIQYSVSKNTNLSDDIALSFVDLTLVNFSSSDPYYAHAFLPQLYGLEGQWTLQWTLNMGSCSGNPDEGTLNITGQALWKAITFTTRNDSQQPDLVAASAESACAGTNESYTFNITDTLSVWDTTKYDGRNSCAVLSPTAPTANPCGAAISSAAASSISLSITSTACALQYPSVTCSPASKSTAGRITLFRDSLSAFVLLIILELHFLLYI